MDLVHLGFVVIASKGFDHDFNLVHFNYFGTYFVGLFYTHNCYAHNIFKYI